MKKINKKLQLKKENISQLQPDLMARIKGGDAQLTSVISCNTNVRTCGDNCCNQCFTITDSCVTNKQR